MRSSHNAITAHSIPTRRNARTVYRFAYIMFRMPIQYVLNR